ncbi:MAG: aldo/keto reductase [Chloroflexi bacterium]|nr:aldo/keto reductase [Chloroflexota bacterium]MYF80993.1 aldo/keto reductase [Chloroflexota bacterium]MYI05152.1 aldo/keto reductase [Chloroflexota bacterium]
MMRYRKLGRTGLVVSEIGVGGGGIGHVWGETTDEAIAETIALAMSEGINFFDVAPSYGNGAAERNLGRALVEALQGVGRDMLVATKVALSKEDLDDVPGAVERGIHESLERLRRERIDIFQLHNTITSERGRYRRSISVDDAMLAVETLHRLKQDGLTRFIGITGMGEAERVREVLGRAELDTVQCYYNLLNDSNARPLPPGSSLHDHGQLLPLAAELGLGVIGIRNLSGGALSNGLDRGVEPQSLVAMDARRAETLRFLEDDGIPLSRWSARFALQQAAISSVVPGVKNSDELADQIAAVNMPDIDHDQLARIDALRAQDFGLPQPDDRVL